MRLFDEGVSKDALQTYQSENWYLWHLGPSDVPESVRWRVMPTQLLTVGERPFRARSFTGRGARNIVYTESSNTIDDEIDTFRHNEGHQDVYLAVGLRGDLKGALLSVNLDNEFYSNEIANLEEKYDALELYAK